MLQVQAGQDHAGAAADANGTQNPTIYGTQSVSVTGLAGTTNYYPHVVHEDDTGRQSAVESGVQFTTDTPAATFPVVQSVAVSYSAWLALPRFFTLPTGIVSGDLLVAFIRTTNNQTMTTPAGWIEESKVTASGEAAVYSRVADGSEGATLTVTMNSNGTVSSGIIYRISGHNSGAVEVAQVSAIDPPNLAPTWGNKNTLFIAQASSLTGNDFSVFPTNYTNNQQIKSVLGTSGSAGDLSAASAERQFAAASDNPSTFTFDGTDLWVVAFTVAIEPAP
ncbi:MAG: hypothetical protein GXP16_12045 [Gammaproteobacteria bacterium]|nr:hypothetical protein [Gammaproteobacteria bacterium]